MSNAKPILWESGDRYYDQELVRVGGRPENIRKDWTIAQKRRALKRSNRSKKFYKTPEPYELMADYSIADVRAIEAIFHSFYLDSPSNGQ